MAGIGAQLQGGSTERVAHEAGTQKSTRYNAYNCTSGVRTQHDDCCPDRHANAHECFRKQLGAARAAIAVTHTTRVYCLGRVAKSVASQFGRTTADTSFVTRCARRNTAHIQPKHNTAMTRQYGTGRGSSYVWMTREGAREESVKEWASRGCENTQRRLLCRGTLYCTVAWSLQIKNTHWHALDPSQ